VHNTVAGVADVSVKTTVPVCGVAVPVKVGAIVAAKTTVPLTLDVVGDDVRVVFVFVGITI
jgi:hypothetical protein